MSKSITLTFDGKNELLLQAIEVFAQSDLFSDDEGNSVKLSVEEIALNMLMEGCIEWVQDVGGLPEELEQSIRDEFEVFDEGCGEECDEECTDEAHNCDDPSHDHHKN